MQMETDLIVDGQPRRSVSRPAALPNLSPALKSKSVGRNPAWALPAARGYDSSPVSPTETWSREISWQNLPFHDFMEGSQDAQRAFQRLLIQPAMLCTVIASSRESIIAQSRTSSGELAAVTFVELDYVKRKPRNPEKYPKRRPLRGTCALLLPAQPPVTRDSACDLDFLVESFSGMSS